MNWLRNKLAWLRNKLACWIKPESQRIAELQQNLELACAVVSNQKDTITGLNVAIGMLSHREQNMQANSTQLIAAIIATLGGEIKLEGNIIDAVVNNKQLSVHIEEIQEDGGRTVRLVEEPAGSIIEEDREPTDEELADIEAEFLDCDDDEFDDDDDLSDLVPR